MSLQLGIDIGIRELKMVQLDGGRLTGHVEIMLPDGAIQDGMPTPLLAAALRGAIEAGGLRASAARLAIADAAIAVRDFLLPRIPRSELQDAVIFEGRRLLPLDPNSVYYAWHAQAVPSGYAVYLVAARREMIDGLSLALSEVGLQVTRIDVKPLALARGAGVADGLVLEWGAAEATLVLMVAGRPRFFRSFLLDAPSEDINAQLDELAFTLNALVRFIRTAVPDALIGPITGLHVVGRIAFIEDGFERAQQRFDFAVRQPKPPSLRMPAGYPWQAHVAGIGLFQRVNWRSRLDPSQGGDVRVAA